MENTQNAAVATRVAQFELPFALNGDAAKVFTTSDIVNKDGSIVGMRLKSIKRGDVATAFGLQPKKDSDELDNRMVGVTDALFTEFKKWVAGCSTDWTLATAQGRFTKGERTMSVKLVERKRTKQDITDETVAKAWFTDAQFPGMTLEEKVAKIRAMREKQQTELKETIELEAATAPSSS